MFKQTLYRSCFIFTIIIYGFSGESDMKENCMDQLRTFHGWTGSFVSVPTCNWSMGSARRPQIAALSERLSTLTARCHVDYVFFHISQPQVWLSTRDYTGSSKNTGDSDSAPLIFCMTTPSTASRNSPLKAHRISYILFSRGQELFLCQACSAMRLRSSGDDAIRLPRSRTELLCCSPFYEGTSLLNSIPPSSKQSWSSLNSHILSLPS